MTIPVTCTGEMTLLQNGLMSCAGDWNVYESDLLQFANLLDFDLNMFGLLFGSAAVLFVIGYSAGVTVRQMHRV